jgi:hypothetical protein
MGLTTYDAMMAPGGLVTAATVAKVRAMLAGGSDGE